MASTEDRGVVEHLGDAEEVQAEVDTEIAPAEDIAPAAMTESTTQSEEPVSEQKGEQTMQSDEIAKTDRSADDSGHIERVAPIIAEEIPPAVAALDLPPNVDPALIEKYSQVSDPARRRQLIIAEHEDSEERLTIFDRIVFGFGNVVFGFTNFINYTIHYLSNSVSGEDKGDNGSTSATESPIATDKV